MIGQPVYHRASAVELIQSALSLFKDAGDGIIDIADVLGGLISHHDLHMKGAS